MKSVMLSNCSIVLLLGCLARACLALPMFLVMSGKGKCIDVEAAKETLLRVNYEAPDIVVDRSDPTYGPTWISIRHREQKSKTAGLKTEELSHRQGHMTYNVPQDGKVEICIRASTASSKSPLRFGFHVEQSADAGLSDDDYYAMQGSNNNEGKFSHQWTHMEEELRLGMRTMRAIQAEADYGKDRDAAFHKEALDMYAASLYWPIVHVTVLLLTGFTQATHIVRFFKQRRLV